MKKILAIILACAMLIPLGVFSAFADASGVSFGNVPHVNDADMTIDGNNTEPAWANALTLQLNWLDGTAGVDPYASGTVSLLWSDDAIYAYYAINDTTIVPPDSDAQVSSPWDCDSVELFLDTTNGGTSVWQYRVDRANYPSVDNRVDGVDTGYNGAADCAPYITYAARSDDANNMYYVEMKVPETGLAANQQIGLQAQINDEGDTTPGDQHTVINLTSSQSATSWDINLYDYIVLSATDAAPATTAAPATDAGTTIDSGAVATTATATSPTTGDNGILAIVLGAIAALGAVVVTGTVAKKRGR
jgi:hypothetical protein